MKRDEKTEIVRVNLWMGMISAMFTISLLANHLVEMTASKSTGRMDDMLIILQVATVLLAAAVLIYFVIAYIRTKRI